MRAFEYASARSKQQAAELLGAKWGDAEVLAGGSDLLALMKDDVVRPRRLVDIKEIPEMRGIRAAGAGFSLGALVTLAELQDDSRLRQRYPALAHALDDAASPQIRNVATLGGNLCQRPRCWYFRGGHGLLARGPDGESLVPKGDNRYHAVLGNEGPAYFVSPSTIAPALVAYGAKVRLFGARGERELPLEKFFRTPKSDGEREHDLAPNEIVTEIVLPSAEGTRSASYEVRQKEAFDWPYATASVVIRMSGNTAQSARIVLGHVAPIPWISPEAEAAVAGKPLDETTAAAAGRAAVAAAKPLSRNRHKIQLATIAVKRALLLAARAAVRG
ncbi:MAG TPA: FAD binding domain-containing protein [Thermoanaerobaculia bacterium]